MVTTPIKIFTLEHFIYYSGKQVEVVDELTQELLVPSFAESVKLTASEIFKLAEAELS